MQANPLLRALEGAGPEISTFWAQMALASLIAFSGHTPSIGPHNGYCQHQNHYILRHVYITYKQ
jgi:hypothetical protein